MLIAGLMMLAAPGGAWVAAGGGPGGAAVEIDRRSLTWRNTQRVAWRMRLAEPRRDGTVEERHVELVDCAGRLTAVIETVSLDGAGRVLNVARDGESLAAQRLSPPTPGTVGETVAERACRLRPPPPRRRR
jgi:hypothetical protein